MREIGLLPKLAGTLRVDPNWLLNGEYAETRTVPAGVVSEPGTARLTVQGHAPTGVIAGEWLAMLRSEPAEKYLDDVHKELRELRVPHDEHDAAMRTVRQPPESAARPPGAPWTAEEVVHVMQQTAEPILRMWRNWKRFQ